MSEVPLYEAIVEVVHKELAKTPIIPEQRIREIVREELAAWEKRQVQVSRFGKPMETK